MAASFATVAKAPWPILAQRFLARQMVIRHSASFSSQAVLWPRFRKHRCEWA